MSEPLRLTLRNDLAEIPRVADAVETFCEPLEPPMKDLMAVQLALEECITNVIQHGYRDAAPHTFTVELSAPEPDRIRMVITDDAPAYDPLARPEVNLELPIEERPIGGLGVHLVKKLMQHASYQRRAHQNILTLERVLGHAD